MSKRGHQEFETTLPKRVIFGRMLALARPYAWYIGGGIAMGLLLMLPAVIQPWIEGVGINQLLDLLFGTGFEWSAFLPLVRIAGIIAAFAAFGMVLRYANTVLMTHLRMKVLTDLQRRVYRKLMHQSFSYFDKQDSGQLINRTIGDVNMLHVFYTMVLVDGPRILFSLLGYMSVLVFFDRWVALVALPFVPVYVFAVVTISRKIHPMFHEMRDQLDEAAIVLSENVQGVQVVRAFAREDVERGRYEKINRSIYERWVRLARTFSAYFPSVFFLGSANLLVMLAMTSYRALEGVLAAGLIWSVFRWSQVLTNNGRMIARMMPAIEHGFVSAERVFEILDAPASIRTPGSPKPMPKGRGRVVFENVTFGYDEHPVLEDIALDIPPGTNVALVGATGSGKSSLIKLLPRFYDPVRGRIRMDGADIRDLDLEELRNEIGFVFQDTFLFSTSLAGNIAFGVPEAERRAIEDAARRAGVDEFVSAFEQGYDTMVGERGVTLSGGQRQRVAIARALLMNPRILILDDATASVDSTTERAIQDAMAEVVKDRTTFIIAHRASTVKRADLIVVLDKGRVVQKGRHGDLIAVPGPYREFCEMQWKLGLDDVEAPQ